MKKNDLIVIKDNWGNIKEYTQITRVNEKTITVGYTKFDINTLKNKWGHTIELFDEKKHGNGYKYDLILDYKKEARDFIEDLELLIKTAKEYNNYIDLKWIDFEEDLSNLFERLKEDFLGLNENE